MQLPLHTSTGPVISEGIQVCSRYPQTCLGKLTLVLIIQLKNKLIVLTFRHLSFFVKKCYAVKENLFIVVEIESNGKVLCYVVP